MKARKSMAPLGEFDESLGLPAPAVPLSAASIAVEVRRKAALQSAEHRLKSLHAERQAVVDRLRSLVDRRDGPDAAAVVAQIKETAARREQLDAALIEATRDILPQQQEHGLAVALALRDRRRECGETILRALMVLRSAAAAADEAAVAILAAGGQAPRFRLPALGEEEAAARRLAGASA